MPLLELLRDFCEKTSMKGVPRIVRTEIKILRGLWLFCVVLFLGLTGYSVSILVLEYFRYGVTLNIMEKPIVIPDMLEGFPALTFCNLNRLSSNSSEILMEENKFSFVEIHEKVSDILEQLDLHPFEIEELQSHLLSHRTYFELLGDEIAERIGHSTDVMVQECHFIGTDGLHTHKIPCQYFGEIKKTQTPDFFNCFTLHPEIQEAEGYEHWSLKGLSVVLFLDDVTEEQHQVSGYDVIGGGCELTLHPANASPSSVHRKYRAAAGTFTTIQIMPWLKSFLPEPYGTCYTKEKTPEILGPDGQPIKYEYNRHTCIQACMQRKIKDSCGCTDSVIPRCRESFPFCGDIESNLEANFSSNSTLRCMMNVLWKKYIGADCQDSCFEPCEVSGEESTISSIPWPGARQRDFFARKICSEMRGKINLESVNCSNREEMDNIIKRNFVKIFVETPDLVVKVQKEVPRLSAASLFSQLGGALNLYAGITLVVVVEVIELIYRVLSSCSSNEVLRKSRVVNITSQPTS